jgi:hypothetical protein
MKKIFLGLIIAGVFGACNETYKDQNAVTNAQMINATAPVAAISAADAANAPVIKFDEEAFGFGKINQGDSVVHQFKFTNVGKSPLIITDAVATCGCTKPEWPKGPVQPGAGGVIKVTFHSVGKSGLQDKMVTITGNTVPAQNMVHLTGEVLVKK